MTVPRAGYGGLAARLGDLGDSLAAMKVRGGLASSCRRPTADSPAV
jgi:hypothetical protein